MDTEFPGVVARPIGTFKSSSDFHYQTLRCNVDLLKIIQLGLTFCNEEGELAPGVCTYQFNFKFSLRWAAVFPSDVARARPSSQPHMCFSSAGLGRERPSDSPRARMQSPWSHLFLALAAAAAMTSTLRTPSTC
eukprot:2949632-Prymnesium_polylepis.1